MKKMAVVAAICIVSASCSAAPVAHKKKADAKQWCDLKWLSGGTDGWHQFSCLPDPKAPAGFGSMQEDKEAEEELAKHEAHKDDLANALTTRVLTPQEMHEVLSLGSEIYTHPMQPYFQDQIDKKFLVALDVQRELRLMAETKDGK